MIKHIQSKPPIPLYYYGHLYYLQTSMGQHSQYSDYDTQWKIWGSNLGRSKRIIPSSKQPDHLQHPPSLQINENHTFFSVSKMDRANSLTTHIHIEPSLKISGAIPPLNLSPSMAHIGTNFFFLYLLPMYIYLKMSHPLWSYKGTLLYFTYLFHAHCMTHLFPPH